MLKKIILILMGLFMASCAYYNTFYNAEKFFESAQKKPLNNKGKAGAAAIEEYNKVIKKCGVILTDYKDSKWADDALFLLAKALYFRGNNELQSKEKFEDLIKFYPDSPFFAESHLYIARIEHDLNNKEKAITQIQDFIKDPQFKDTHPKALILITDLLMKDKKILDAQFYLRMLIEKYPKAEEFEQAYFLLAKSYFDNQDFTNSLKTFEDLLDTRIEKKIKLDATYYIAYNNFQLKNLKKAKSVVKQLMKQEYREEAIQKILLLNARITAESGNLEEAISVIENIIVNNPRSLLSAEASYYLGEIYFSRLNDYEKAIQTFNKVKNESNISPFIEKSITRSAIASQIIQLKKPNRNLPLDDLLAEQFKLAEYYLYELELPDSALKIYESIPGQAHNLTIRIQDVQLKSNRLDSLITLQNNQILTDSLIVDFNRQFSDSLNFSESESDSTRLSKLNLKKQNLGDLLTILKKDQVQYQTYYIPYSIFIQMIINDYILKDKDKFNLLKTQIENDYPENRFTVAINDYLQNKPITFLTSYEKNLTDLYEKASELPSDSLNAKIDLMSQIAESNYSTLSEQAKFTTGYLYYFEKGDSSSAKEFFDEVLKINPNSEYSLFIKQFYVNSKFLVIDKLPSIIELEEKLKNQLSQDSLKADSLSDSTFTKPTPVENSGKKESYLSPDPDHSLPQNDFYKNYFALMSRKTALPDLKRISQIQSVL